MLRLDGEVVSISQDGISIKAVKEKGKIQGEELRADGKKRDDLQEAIAAINDHEFNEVLWKGLKGENAIVPAPRRAAFLKMNPKKDADD